MGKVVVDEEQPQNDRGNTIIVFKGVFDEVEVIIFLDLSDCFKNFQLLTRGLKNETTAGVSVCS